MKRFLGGVIAVVVAAFLADYVSAKYKIPRSRQVLDCVEVERDFGVHLQDKTIEYTAATAVEEECVLSLFPHFGDPPCWYLRRHTRQHVELDGKPPLPKFVDPMP
jgi:hypothetical protein